MRLCDLAETLASSALLKNSNPVDIERPPAPPRVGHPIHASSDEMRRLGQPPKFLKRFVEFQSGRSTMQ